MLKHNNARREFHVWLRARREFQVWCYAKAQPTDYLLTAPSILRWLDQVDVDHQVVGNLFQEPL